LRFWTGTLYQYNYSHDNEGGFMLLCDAKNFNSVIRYNISENDRKHLFLAANTLDPKWTSDISEAEVGQVYNNTFILVLERIQISSVGKVQVSLE
jgi:hypothetical protein